MLDGGLFLPGWRKRAACRGRQSVMFGTDVEAARAICAGCTEREECLAFALDVEAADGVWAGLTWDQRVELCPVCLGPKAPDALGCSMAHSLVRQARLVDQAAEGDPDVELPPRQAPTARSNPYCALPRGHNHSSAQAYRRGCRCRPAWEALHEERLDRRRRHEEEAVRGGSAGSTT